MIRGGEQLGQPTRARNRDPLAPRAAALPTILKSLAATLNIPVAADDLTAGGRDGALAGGELARDRQRGILRIITRNTPIERKRLHPATPLVGLDGGSLSQRCKDNELEPMRGDPRPTASAARYTRKSEAWITYATNAGCSRPIRGTLLRTTRCYAAACSPRLLGGCLSSAKDSTDRTTARICPCFVSTNFSESPRSRRSTIRLSSRIASLTVRSSSLETSTLPNVSS